MCKALIRVVVVVASMATLVPVYGVPKIISYQGVLNDSGGVPVTGTLQFTFALYAAASGGTALWTETQMVSVSNGVFNVQLGSSTALPPSIFFRDRVYLGIKVGADVEMTPRQLITPGGYSIRASRVIDVGNGSDGAYNDSGNLEPGRVYQFSSFTLSSGATLSATTNSGAPIIVKVSGNCMLAGTVDLRGKGYSRNEGSSSAALSGATPTVGAFERRVTGYGGAGTTGYFQDSPFMSITPLGGLRYPALMYLNKDSGMLLIAAGAGGGDGWSEGASFAYDSSGGSGGAGYLSDGQPGTAGHTGGWLMPGAAGGSGGGAILFIVGGDFTASGTIDVRGTDGAGGTRVPSGGGGGGGAAWVLVAGTITDTSTKLTTGGAGGVFSQYGMNGGAGGTGIVKIENF